MELAEAFKNAQDSIKSLTTRPSNEQLLEIYALFKQGSVGDVSGKRPGMLDMKGRAKYDSWASQKGKSKDAAQQEYVDLAAKLKG